MQVTLKAFYSGSSLKLGGLATRRQVLQIQRLLGVRKKRHPALWPTRGYLCHAQIAVPSSDTVTCAQKNWIGPEVRESRSNLASLVKSVTVGPSPQASPKAERSDNGRVILVLCG
jgi:hypothetical protein